MTNFSDGKIMEWAETENLKNLTKWCIVLEDG